MTAPVTPDVTVNELPLDQLRPISRILHLDRSIVLAHLQELHRTTVVPVAGDGPPLDTVPTSCDSIWTSGDGPDAKQYFVPAAEIAKRSPTSGVPAVFIDRVSGGWSMRVIVNLRRHPYFDQDQGKPLEVGDLTVRLYCPLDGSDDSLPISDVTDQPPTEAGVVRKLVCRVPVTNAWIDRMRTNPGIVLLVTGVPRFSRSPSLEQEITRQVATGNSSASAPVTVMMTVDPAGASMFFPAGPATDPIFSQIDGKGGDDWILGPGGPWQAAPASNQFYTLPTEYRLAFDTEHGQPAVTVLLLEPAAAAPGAAGAAYRVRVRFKLVPWFDPELMETLRHDISDSTGVAYPDLVVGGYQNADFATSTLFNDLGGTVLGADAASTAVDGRGFELVFDCSMEFYTLMCGLLAPRTGAPTGLEGRVRFTLAPAVEGGSPTVRDVPVRIRLDIPTDSYLTFEQVPLPDPDTWPPGWIPPVYARVRNLAPGDADVAAAVAVLLVEGQKDQPPDAAIAATAAPGKFRVPAAGTPAPPAPPAPPTPPAFPGTLTIDPGHDKPPVRTYQTRLVELGYMKPADVDGRYGKYSTAMTKRFQHDTGLRETGDVDQATWQAAFPLQPPPPPPAGSGELVLTLSATSPVDPSSIGALALGFAGVTLHMEAATVLEKVHQLAATSTEGATVRVRSFQLAHPENLPSTLGDLYGIEVQIKRADRQPVTAYLTKEEPDKTVTLTLLINDLVAGVDPQQPTFDWRRRNMTQAGTGAFSPWETVTGRELFVTPVVPEA